MKSGPNKLRVERGDVITAAQHNGLVKLAESLTWQRGRLKGRRETGGFIPRITLGGGSPQVQHPWAVQIDEAKDGVLLLTIAPGTVAGIVPVLDDLALDDEDKAGDPPQLAVLPEAWAKRGRGERSLVMLRYELSPALDVLRVVPVAVPAVPPPAAFRWHKLLGFLTRAAGETRYRPMCFFPQNFNALPGKTAGRFQPLPHVA